MTRLAKYLDHRSFSSKHVVLIQKDTHTPDRLLCLNHKVVGKVGDTRANIDIRHWRSTLTADAAEPHADGRQCRPVRRRLNCDCHCAEKG